MMILSQNIRSYWKKTSLNYSQNQLAGSVWKMCIKNNFSVPLLYKYLYKTIFVHWRTTRSIIVFLLQPLSRRKKKKHELSIFLQYSQIIFGKNVLCAEGNFVHKFSEWIKHFRTGDMFQDNITNWNNFPYFLLVKNFFFNHKFSEKLNRM